MDYRKQLIKHMDVMWPFYGVSIPKTMKCSDGEISDAGVEFYDGDESSEGCFWESAEFIGDFILVNFDCKEKFRGGPVKIKLRNLSFVSHPRDMGDVKVLMDELQFITEVVESGD